MREFSRRQNVTLDFVATTWPTLSADLEEGTRCLIAAGGIGWTKQRAALFAVSDALRYDRKVPVFSRRFAARFHKLEDLDALDVIILENAGGTNEAFAASLFSHGLLRRPRYLTVTGNLEAYACLRAFPDVPLVMFTDTIEADFRSATEGSMLTTPGGGFGIPDELNPERSKVVLARNTTEGVAAIAAFDAFLAAAVADGLLQAWMEQAFSTKYEEPEVLCPLGGRSPPERPWPPMLL